MESNFEKMTPELRTYLDYDSHEPGAYEERLRLKALVQPGLVNEYYRVQKDAVFDPENEVPGSRREVLSPSGRYSLSVACFRSKTGGWSYSQGRVFASGTNDPIAVVNRNYGAFPSTFVEKHPNGHDYLVCGEDYQGQTVVELDSHRRLDSLPEEAEEGHAFCWADAEFDAAAQMLVVCGCYWACPYEFRFYDFSDPMAGWPEIESTEGAEEDVRRPTVEPDGTVKCYQTESSGEEGDEDVPPRERVLSATKTFRRDGLRLVLVEEWISEKEQKARSDREEASRKYDEWLKDFRASDPLYLLMAEAVKDPAFSPDGYDSVGVTYENWSPDYKGDDRRMCRRIASVKYPKMDLEWGVKEAPVKLIVYRDASVSETKWFEHSAAGMAEALAYARTVLR